MHRQQTFIIGFLNDLGRAGLTVGDQLVILSQLEAAQALTAPKGTLVDLGDAARARALRGVPAATIRAWVSSAIVKLDEVGWPEYGVPFEDIDDEMVETLNRQDAAREREMALQLLDLVRKKLPDCEILVVPKSGGGG